MSLIPNIQNPLFKAWRTTDDNDHLLGSLSDKSQPFDDLSVKAPKMGKIVLLRRPEKKDTNEDDKATSTATESKPQPVSNEKNLVNSINEPLNSTPPASTVDDNKFGDPPSNTLTLEQREIAYEEARRRIFGMSSEQSTNDVYENNSTRPCLYTRSFRSRPLMTSTIDPQGYYNPPCYPPYQTEVEPVSSQILRYPSLTQPLLDYSNSYINSQSYYTSSTTPFECPKNEDYLTNLHHLSKPPYTSYISDYSSPSNYYADSRHSLSVMTTRPHYPTPLQHTMQNITQSSIDTSFIPSIPNTFRTNCPIHYSNILYPSGPESPAHPPNPLPSYYSVQPKPEQQSPHPPPPLSHRCCTI